MKNADQMTLAMMLIGALMRRLGVEQADFYQAELNDVKGAVSVESLPGSQYVRVDLRPDATNEDDEE